MADVKLVNAACLGTTSQLKARITHVFYARTSFFTDGIMNGRRCHQFLLHRVGMDFHQGPMKTNAVVTPMGVLKPSIVGKSRIPHTNALYSPVFNMQDMVKTAAHLSKQYSKITKNSIFT